MASLSDARFAQWGGLAEALSSLEDLNVALDADASLKALFAKLSTLETANRSYKDCIDTMHRCQFTLFELSRLNSPLLDGLVYALTAKDPSQLAGHAAVTISAPAKAESADPKECKSIPLRPPPTVHGAIMQLLTAKVKRSTAVSWFLQCQEVDVGWQKQRMLLAAIRQDDIDTVKQLMARGAGVSANDQDALREAVRANRLEIAQLLVKAGAAVNNGFQMGLFSPEPVLASAARQGAVEMIDFLLAQGANARASSHIAIRRAAGHGQLPALQLLVQTLTNAQLSKSALESAESPLAKFAIDDNAALDILIDAASYEHVATLAYLLELGKWPRAMGRDALTIAISDDRLEAVKLLLASSPDLVLDNDVVTTAVNEGSASVLQLLYSLGMRFSTERDQDFVVKTALTVALQRPAVLRLLHDRGVPFSKNAQPMLAAFLADGPEAAMLAQVRRVNECHATFSGLFVVACEHGFDGVVRFMLEANARSTCVKMHHFERGLIRAVEQNHPTTVRVLVENGASVNMADGNPLQRACELGLQSMVELLLQLGADPDLSSSDTALCCAVRRNHLAVVKLLLERGVEVQLQRSLVQVAQDRGNQDMVDLLLDKGAQDTRWL